MIKISFLLVQNGVMVRINFFGVDSGFIWNHWMGARHVAVNNRHLGK